MKAKQTYADGEGDFGGLKTIAGCYRWAARRIEGTGSPQQVIIILSTALLYNENMRIFVIC